MLIRPADGQCLKTQFKNVQQMIGHLGIVSYLLNEERVRLQGIMSTDRGRHFTSSARTGFFCADPAFASS